MTSKAHNPPLLNPLFADCMHRLLEHGLLHFPHDTILRNEVPCAKSDAFQIMLNCVSVSSTSNDGGSGDLEHSNTSSSSSSSERTRRLVNLYCSPVRDLYTQRHLAGRLSSLLHRRGVPLCPYCWITVDHCGCKLLPLNHGLSSHMVQQMQQQQKYMVVQGQNGAGVGNGIRYRFVVYMHHYEVFRTSNSAKLLLSIVPNTELIVAGLSQDERRLEETYFSDLNSSNTLVLYPSEGSLTFAEYFQQRAAAIQEVQQTQGGTGGDDGDVSDCTTHASQEMNECLSANEQQVLNIILLDGTWSNARCLARRIPPHIQRIKLTTIEGYLTLFNSLRKMSKERLAVSRVSTFEAATLAMRELGQSEELIDSLHNNFKCMINYVNVINRRGSSLS